MIKINDTLAGVTFVVKIHPRAQKNAITGQFGDVLKLSLTAPPVEAGPMRPVSNLSQIF